MNERILVVHPVNNMVRLIQFALERQGYQVESAASGVEALGLAAQNRPDLLIAYENMPILSGSELIDSLRREPALATLPAILIRPGRHGGESQFRAVTNEEREMLTMELPQPFNPAEVVAFAGRLLGKTSQPV